MNWYKLAKTKTEFPFDLDDIWKQINNLSINDAPSMSKSKSEPKKIGIVNDTNNDIEVFLVNGDEIEKKHSMDFVVGGNDGSDPEFIPEKQIWVDYNMSTDVIPHIIYHEFIELYLMKHKDMSYEAAHDIANKYEKKRITV